MLWHDVHCALILPFKVGRWTTANIGQKSSSIVLKSQKSECNFGFRARRVPRGKALFVNAKAAVSSMDACKIGSLVCLDLHLFIYLLKWSPS